jgi:uncharacterized protein (TIGR00730 family)
MNDPTPTIVEQAPAPSTEPAPSPPDPRWGKTTPTIEEGQFLEGPRTRRFEFFRVLRIAGEFIRGFRRLHFVGPCVTFFGSARFGEGHRYYALARETAHRVAELGFTIMTGGGPGTMEAANRGAIDAAREAGYEWTGPQDRLQRRNPDRHIGRSIGCNIVLPMEQDPNQYLDTFIEFRYFFVRKVMLVKYSYAFVVLPGGFGTMDEVFEAVTLVQTGKIKDFPIILMGRDYWKPLLDFMRARLLAEGAISPEDVNILAVTDSPEEAVQLIAQTALKKFGFHWGKRRAERPKPHLLLGEENLEPGAEEKIHKRAREVVGKA